MLQGINKIGRSWVGRVIVAVMFGFLIVSFAIWGIGDIFRGTTRTQVATVGGIDISAEQFRNAYQSEYQNLVRRAGRAITPDQARALGLENRVLSRLVSDAAFDSQTRDLGLGIPDELVIRAVQADPAFQGPGGRFDHGTLVDLLRQNGLTEAQYIAERRRVMAREELAQGLVGALKVPLALREVVHRFQAERRTAEYLKLVSGVLGDMPAPSDAQVQSYYDDNKAAFRAPEYRSFNLLVLDARSLAKPEAVSDADARAYYDRVKDSRFGAPERRTVQQIPFPTMAEAQAASERIAGGLPFDTIAGERGIDEKSLDLGTFTRGEMIDPAVAEAAFSLNEGAVSAPVQGRFGPVLIRVSKVEKGSLKPFDEVADEVKKDVALERARNEVQTVHDAIEDQRAGAKPLTEIAREHGLTLAAYDGVDRAGQDKAGHPVASIPDRDAVLAAVFRSEVGADTEAVATPDGGFVWYDVTSIDPARERPLADLRDQVIAAWRKAEAAKALAGKAQTLVERLNKGDAIAAVASEAGVRSETASDIARGTAKDGLTAAATTRLFATPVGQAASVETEDGGRLVFKVTGASVPPFVTTTQESVDTETRLRPLLADDILAQYIADVEKRIGVELYPANVRRAIGGET